MEPEDAMFFTMAPQSVVSKSFRHQSNVDTAQDASADFYVDPRSVSTKIRGQSTSGDFVRKSQLSDADRLQKLSDMRKTEIPSNPISKEAIRYSNLNITQI